jgi:hypothetical protein
MKMILILMFDNAIDIEEPGRDNTSGYSIVKLPKPPRKPKKGVRDAGR